MLCFVHKSTRYRLGITNEMLTAARGMGLQGKDFAILFETLARMSGVSKG